MSQEKVVIVNLHQSEARFDCYLLQWSLTFIVLLNGLTHQIVKPVSLNPFSIPVGVFWVFLSSQFRIQWCVTEGGDIGFGGFFTFHLYSPLWKLEDQYG